MKFSDIFRNAKPLWPDSIDISDGELLAGEAYFPWLSSVSRAVEALASLMDPWQEIMAWAVFCGFHKVARERLVAGNPMPVSLTDVDLGYVQERFAQRLYSEDLDWSPTLKEQYINDYTSKS